jgi:hypothetical protein
MTSQINADSLLVIDVGAVTTRAVIFDVVDGRYRFVAQGAAPTTASAPYRNVSEGVRLALDQLQSITGRTLIGRDEQLIIPSTSEGTGIDTFAATFSAGPPLKVIAMGLLEDISLESARRLATTTYSKILQTFSLNDRRKPDARLNAIIRLRPDLIIATGGTENGASQSVLKLLESVGLACYVLPEAQRPDLLFVGNQTLDDELRETLGGVTNLHFAPNVRPSLEVETLEAAQAEVASLLMKIRSRQIPGVEELNHWAGGGLLPTATAFGRVIRFMSKKHKTMKGSLGIDLGASATTVAASFGDDFILSVYPQLGLGRGLVDLLDYCSIPEIMRWLAVDISEDGVRDYIYNKALHPASLPASLEELAIEQAIARQAMACAVKLARKAFPPLPVSSGENLMPWVEPILATGSVLTQAPSLAQSVMMLLDGLQPTGITTLWLDQNHIASALGAAAAVNPVLAVQVIYSNAFLILGTVITPVGHARPGSPVLRLKMSSESTQDTNIEIKQGALEVLHLPYGQKATLHLQPLQRYDIGMGVPGRGGGITVTGGMFGVIIDARGRPLPVIEDRARRQELFNKWQWTLGGP